MHEKTDTEAKCADWTEPAKRRRVSYDRRPMSKRKGNAFFWMFWIFVAAIVPAAFMMT